MYVHAIPFGLGASQVGNRSIDSASQPAHARYHAALCATRVDAFVYHARISTHLPELLAGVLAAYSLQDLGSARVLFHKPIHLVYIVVDDDVQALVDTSSLFDIVGGEFLGHVGGFRSRVWIWTAVRVDSDVVAMESRRLSRLYRLVALNVSV